MVKNQTCFVRCALFSSSLDGERKAHLLLNVRNETAMKDVVDGGLFFSSDNYYLDSTSLLSQRLIYFFNCQQHYFIN